MKNSKDSQRGQGLILAILLVVAIGAIMMVGGFTKPPLEEGANAVAADDVKCCDSGNGDKCRVDSTKNITWKGSNDQPEIYSLLKSGVALNYHAVMYSGPDGRTPDGKPIFVNSNGRFCRPTTGGNVVCKTNDIIFVCQEGCEGIDENTVGTTEGIFNAYYRVSDGPVPERIKNCAVNNYRPIMARAQPGKQKVIVPTTRPGDTNLQLQTFKVQQERVLAPWLSPVCKPAIYLYPESTSYVNVKLDTSLPLTYTLPLYPSVGWGVLANPNGIIGYESKTYDYLYYETKIPDSSLDRPTEGFVVKENKLSTLFKDILPKLGLNNKEERQFSEYWLKVLPESPYYFVGIVPQTFMDSLVGLSIIPTPKTVIRVNLYFEPLESETYVKGPTIFTPKRNGFTVVEWGGIFKKDKNSTFSCFQ